MTLAFDHLPTPDSPLRRLDPRWKLAALVLAVASAASWQAWPIAAVGLIGSLALAVLGRLPGPWLWGRLTAVGLFLVPLLVLLPLLASGSPAWHLGLVSISRPGLELALLVALKALAIVTLLLVLLATAPLPATLQAAHRLHVPGLIVQLTMLTYRYLFVLADELARLRVALRVRGYRNRMTRHSYRTISHVAGTLLVRGYERAERVGQAMRCRGFDGRFHSLVEFQTRPTDVAAFAAIAAGALGLWLADYRL